MNETAFDENAKKTKSGCLGKGCLIIIGLIVVLIAILTGGSFIGLKYGLTSAKPIELPAIVDSPEQQRVLTERWNEFVKGSRENKASGSQQPLSLQYTADDLNQLVSANRKARGKGYLRIDGNVGKLQVSFPLTKMPFRGQFLNAECEVHSSPDRDPLKLKIEKLTVSGKAIPESALNVIFSGRSLTSYLQQYINEYGVTGFAIENNTVVLESGTKSAAK